MTIIPSRQRSTVKTIQKLPFKTYLSYALGDTGDNIIFSTISSVMTLFYTDYIGISPASVALVMLISRILDGVSDFIAGLCMQRTKSKYGMCRPWLLWISVPFSISVVACFTVPPGSEFMKTVYIFIAYNFATTICYTFSNLSQATLCSLMSRDTKEREKLGVWRLSMAPLGHILASGLSLPLVNVLGNNQAAWIKVMSIWAVYALVVHLICFFNCPETVKIPARDNAKRPSLPKQLKALFSNQYWWWAIIFWTLWATSFGINGTTMSYYMRYILGDDNLYSILFIVEKVFWGLSIILMPLIRRSGIKKWKLLVAGSACVILGQAILFVAPYNVAANYAVVILRGIGAGPSAAFFNGIVADVVEFGQWKTHQRQETLVFSASSVGQKVGGGVILAFVTLILDLAGFISSTTGGASQPVSALSAIHQLYIWAPLLIYGIMGIVCIFYRLEDKLPGIMKELEQRESKGEL